MEDENQYPMWVEVGLIALGVVTYAVLETIVRRNESADCITTESEEA